MPKNKDDLVVELLQEVREEQKTHSTILIELQRDVSTNTKDLTEHILGVVQNRKRIEELERPREAFKLLRKYLLGIGGVAAAVLTVLKLLNYL